MTLAEYTTVFSAEKIEWLILIHFQSDFVKIDKIL